MKLSICFDSRLKAEQNQEQSLALFWSNKMGRGVYGIRGYYPNNSTSPFLQIEIIEGVIQAALTRGSPK